MATPCILTLHPDAGIITGKEKIVAYVISHMFLRPGESSSIYEDMCISFRKIDASSASPEYIAHSVQSALLKVLGNYFTDGSVEVKCTATISEEDPKLYTLTIVVTDANNYGRLILTDATITKTNDTTNPFKINFN